MQETKEVDRLVRAPEAMKILGSRRSMFYKRVADGEIPKPRKRGRESLWLLSELQQCVRDFVERADAKND